MDPTGGFTPMQNRTELQSESSFKESDQTIDKEILLQRSVCPFFWAFFECFCGFRFLFWRGLFLDVFMVLPLNRRGSPGRIFAWLEVFGLIGFAAFLSSRFFPILIALLFPFLPSVRPTAPVNGKLHFVGK